MVLNEERHALATGDVEFIQGDIAGLLRRSKISLDPACEDYRRCGMMILSQEVQALETVHKGEGRPSRSDADSSKSGIAVEALVGYGIKNMLSAV